MMLAARLAVTLANATAEGVGFEPTVGCPTLDFESSALNRTQPPFLRNHRKLRTPNFRHPTSNANLLSKIRCSELGVRVWRFLLVHEWFLTNAPRRNKRRLEQSWLRHCQCLGREVAMIRANCRERFTAADFDFIV